MTKTLFRATNKVTDAASVPAGSCWSDDRATAEAYTENQGFGGAQVVSIELNSDRVLDVRGSTARDLSKLAEAVDGDAQGWRDDGLDSVFAVLENRSKIRSKVEAMADWIIYLDDFPADATTYRKL